MSWNDGVERKKFERNWSKDEKAYREAGMSEEQILSIRELKEEQYRSERRYQIVQDKFNATSALLSLYRNYRNLSITGK